MKNLVDRDCCGKQPACQGVLPTTEHPIVSHNRGDHRVHVDTWDRDLNVYTAPPIKIKLKQYYSMKTILYATSQECPIKSTLHFGILTLQEVKCEGASKEEVDEASRGDTKSRVISWVKAQEAKAKQ